MESLNSIIEEIEQGELADAKKSEVDLLEEMAETEIATLKVIHLNDAIAYFERASEIDADNYAELTYEKAEKKLDAAISYTEKNYRDREGVAAAGIEALIATKKAYYVALESESLVKMKPEDSEKHVLEVMSLLNKIHLSASGTDIDPAKLFNQTENIIKQIEQLKAKPQIKSESSTPERKAFSAPLEDESPKLENESGSPSVGARRASGPDRK